MRYFLSLVVLCTSLSMLSHTSNAGTLAYEGFYTTSTGTGDSYQANTTIRSKTEPRLGFTGPWTHTDSYSTSVDFYPRTATLTYGPVVTSAGRVELFRTGGDSTATKSIQRDFDYSFSSSDDIWVGFLVNYHFDTPDASPPNFLSIVLDGTYDTNFTIDVNGDATVTGGGVSGSTLNLGNLSESSTSTLDDAETHFVVIRAADSVAGPSNLYDVIDVWVDPLDVLNLGTPTASGYGIFREQTGSDGLVAAFNQIRIEGKTEPDGYRGWVDEFRIGTELIDVTGIPEPSTLVMLAGLAAAGLLGCARGRRQN